MKKYEISNEINSFANNKNEYFQILKFPEGSLKRSELDFSDPLYNQIKNNSEQIIEEKDIKEISPSRHEESKKTKKSKKN